MADNFKILKDNLDQAIDPNAGIGQILAQEHNNVFTEFISKAGKYTGLPLMAMESDDNGAVPTGAFVWNGNAMNDTGGFTITIDEKTLDLNNVKRILETLAIGSIIHFKDYVGRSVHLIFKSFRELKDSNSTTIFNIEVSGVSENINYAYQPGEKEFCIVEFYNLSQASNGAFLQNVQVKYFNLFNGPQWQEANPQIFYSQGTTQQFTLANNEVGVFWSKGQNNDYDVYDFETIHIFTKGGGTWGGGPGANPVSANDFILIHKSQFATNLPIGVANSDLPKNPYFDINYFIAKATETSKYITSIHEAMATRLDLMQLLFSWSSRRDDNAGLERSRHSKRIGGSVNFLSVTFQDFDVFKQKDIADLEYTLLIDRYRPHEWKGNTARHRKAKYRHELIPSVDGYESNRINEIRIDNSTMILDFNQDFYFREWTGKIDDIAKFPAPMGVSPRRCQVNNWGRQNGMAGTVKRRTGWVDLGFRIRLESPQFGLKYETRYLGFIRMLGIANEHGDGGEPRQITYVMRQH